MKLKSLFWDIDTFVSYVIREKAIQILNFAQTFSLEFRSEYSRLHMIQMRWCLKIIYFCSNNDNQTSMRIFILHEWYTFWVWMFVLLIFWFLKCNFLTIENYLSWKYPDLKTLFQYRYNGKTDLRLESLRNRVLEPKKCLQIWIWRSILWDFLRSRWKSPNPETFIRNHLSRFSVSKQCKKFILEKIVQTIAK